MKKIYLILIIAVLIGGLLRFIALGKNPSSMNVDEVSIGYNAYSILKTARDENGKFMPISFASLGDYKPPLYIYLTVIPVGIFGLNEFSTRFMSAFFGVLAIPIIYLLLFEITKNIKVAVISAFMLAISPWHIYYSRIASESLVATTISMFGAYLLYKSENKKILYLILAGITMALGMYTYHAHRIFIPLISIVIITYLGWKNNFKSIFVYVITSFILLLPLGMGIILGNDGARAQTQFIVKDVWFINYSFIYSQKILLNSPLIQVIYISVDLVRKIFRYFEPNFLFATGLNLTSVNTYGMGTLYLFDLIFLSAGIYSIIKDFNSSNRFIFLWLILGLVPAGITLNDQHPIRSLIILPALIYISTIGILKVITWIKNIKLLYLKLLFTVLVIGLIIWDCLHAYLVFAIYYPYERNEGNMEQTKETVLYALKNYDKYDQIVFDPKRGIDEIVINVPHAYILFYSKYDPKKYQTIKRTIGEGVYSFDKFTIRNVDWFYDSHLKNTLFIVSSLSVRSKDIKPGELIEKFYLKNGNLALMAISSISR